MFTRARVGVAIGTHSVGSVEACSGVSPWFFYRVICFGFHLIDILDKYIGYSEAYKEAI
jgi:hypothetical protein